MLRWDGSLHFPNPKWVPPGDRDPSSKAVLSMDRVSPLLSDIAETLRTPAHKHNTQTTHMTHHTSQDTQEKHTTHNAHAHTLCSLPTTTHNTQHTHSLFSSSTALPLPLIALTVIATSQQQHACSARKIFDCKSHFWCQIRISFFIQQGNGPPHSSPTIYPE